MAATILSHASLSFPGQSDDSGIVVGSIVVLVDEELRDPVSEKAISGCDGAKH